MGLSINFPCRAKSLKQYVQSNTECPKGTAIIGGVLYVADVDRIVGISLSMERRQQQSIFLPINFDAE